MAVLVGRLPARIERRWRAILLCNGNNTPFLEHGPYGGCGTVWVVSSDDLWWVELHSATPYPEDLVGFRCSVGGCGALTVMTAEDLEVPYGDRQVIRRTEAIPDPEDNSHPTSVWERLDEEP